MATSGGAGGGGGSGGGRKHGKTTSLAVVTTGTSSDLLPYLALALGLQSSGFKVTVVTHGVHGGMVSKLGLPFAALRGDPQGIMASTAFRDAVASENVYSVAALFKAASDAVVPENCNLILAATKDMDGIVCGYPVLTECSAVAQKYQIPCILAPLLPFSPTGEIPVALFMPKPLSYAWLNKLTYDLSGWLLWTAMGRVYNRFRTHDLRIGPQSGFELDGVAQVTAFSDIVVPRPHDWGGHIHMSGSWHLPNTVAAATLATTHPVLSSLVALPPTDARLRPIVISFDCVPVPEVVPFLHICHALSHKYSTTVIVVAGATDMDAARSSIVLESFTGVVWEMAPVFSSSPRAGGGQSATSPAPRPVAVTSSTTPSRAGGGGAGALPATAGGDGGGSDSRPSVLVVREVPFTWLLPACSLIIHQGGAEVTQAAFMAGIPSAAFPAYGEQYFWAARICMLGAGPVIYYPFRHMMAKLAEMIMTCRLPDVVAKAAALGTALRARGDGVQTAVARIRDILTRPQHRHCGVTCTWTPDHSSDVCSLCDKPFTMTQRRRHCRSCGRLACAECLNQRCHLPGFPETAPQITCIRCLDVRRSFLAMHAGKSALPNPPAAVAGGAVVDVPLDGAVSPAGALSFTSPARTPAVATVTPARKLDVAPFPTFAAPGSASTTTAAVEAMAISATTPVPRGTPMNVGGGVKGTFASSKVALGEAASSEEGHDGAEEGLNPAFASVDLT